LENFTPIEAIIGGLLIGLSSSFLLLLNGKIAGMSGLASQLHSSYKPENFWRILFLVGLVLGCWVFKSSSAGLQEIEITGSLTLIIAGGVLTGLGTRMARGCTSGHGVSGIGRLSLRSLIAVPVFLGVAILTVFTLKNWIGL
jgi:uncharacterized membrane protein YedE/YeeE